MSQIVFESFGAGEYLGNTESRIINENRSQTQILVCKQECGLDVELPYFSSEDRIKPALASYFALAKTLDLNGSVS